MKYNLSIKVIGLLMLILISSCKSKETDPNTTIEILEQFSELQAMIDTKDHEVMVLNFWSTACPPCIKEMPHFNKLAKEYQNKKVKVLLVSLEKATRLKTHIYPFVEKNGIVPEVMVLKDQNYRIWTDKISKTWFGALPATLIINGDKRKFRFGSYQSYEELRLDVDGLIEQK